MAYVRDNDQTVVGFTSYEEAAKCAAARKEKLNDPKEERFRIRIRRRTRTSCWDVIVKKFSANTAQLQKTD